MGSNSSNQQMLLAYRFCNDDLSYLVGSSSNRKRHRFFPQMHGMMHGPDRSERLTVNSALLCLILVDGFRDDLIQLLAEVPC